MALKKREGTCAECGTPITRLSRTGYCRPHAIARLNADPEYRARRRAGLDRYFAQPGTREARGNILRAYNRDLPPDELERRREHGRWLRREILTPEVLARTQTPEARARATARGDATKFGWCPPELRDAYRHLIRSKKIPAAEARKIIEAEIAGTPEHARREIASRELAQKLRHERDRAEAY